MKDVQNINTIEWLFQILDQSTVKCILENNGWLLPCKIKNYLSNYEFGGVVFGKNYNFVTELKFERPTNFNIADKYIYHEHYSSDESDSNSEFTLVNSESNNKSRNNDNKYSDSTEFDEYFWK